MRRRLLIRFWELLDRIGARISIFALSRRSRSCGCDVCSRRGDATGEAEAIRALIAGWTGDEARAVRDGRVN